MPCDGVVTRPMSSAWDAKQLEKSASSRWWAKGIGGFEEAAPVETGGIGGLEEAVPTATGGIGGLEEAGMRVRLPPLIRMKTPIASKKISSEQQR